jgi:hypothetical protein
MFPLLCALSFALTVAGCSDSGDPEKPQAGGIESDADLFALIAETRAAGGFSLFPGVDSLVSGTLNGSTAHQPLVRVSVNQSASGSLTADTLADGASFAPGSMIVKDIIEGGATTLIAVIMKDPDNPEAGGGWLWAEYRPDGGVFISLTRKGSGCVPCHSREQGPGNDLVRTFERRIP